MVADAVVKSLPANGTQMQDEIRKQLEGGVVFESNMSGRPDHDSSKTDVFQLRMIRRYRSRF
jgi:hypothetical protein